MNRGRGAAVYSRPESPLSNRAGQTRGLEEKRPKMWRELPENAHPGWIRKCSPLLEEYCAAVEGENVERRNKALSDFLDLPQKYLRAPHGTGMRARARIARCLDRSEAAAPIEADDHGVRAQETILEERKIKKAVALVSRGLARKAIQTLSQTGAKTSSVQTLAELRELHPSARAEMKGAREESTHAPVSVDQQIIQKLILKRMCSASAPGPSGWTGELLAVLIRERECGLGIAAIVRDICNGVFEGSIRDRLTASCVIGIEKSDGSVRPIAMGEVLYKLAGMYLVSMIPDAACSLFPTVQYGVGIPAGTEKAFHNAVVALRYGPREERMDVTPERKDGEPRRIAICCDIRNAFNSISRQKIFEALEAEPKCAHMLPFYQWAYRKPSLLLHYNGSKLIGTLSSEEGVKQGDPMGALLFALGIHDLVSHLNDDLPAVQVFAYLDDLTMVGPHQQLKEAFLKLQEGLPTLSLTLNMRKSYVLDLERNCQQSAELADSVGLNLLHEGTLLGAAVGSDRFVKKSVRAKANEARPLLQLMSSRNFPAQPALILLRVSRMFTMHYLARLIPPRLAKFGMRLFDQHIQATFQQLARIPPGQFLAAHVDRMYLPVALGGFGLVRMEQRSPASYLASLKMALSPATRSSLAAVNPYISVEVSLARDLLKKTLEDTPTEPLEALLREPLSVDGLERKVAKLNAARLRNASEAQDKTGVVSAGSKGALSWMLAYPSRGDLRMPNSAVVHALHMLLNLQSDSRCRCRVRSGNVRHLLNCGATTAGMSTLRHHRLRDTLADLHLNAGWRVRKEQVFGSQSQRMDLVVEDPYDHRIFYVDVSVVDPEREFTLTIHLLHKTKQLPRRTKCTEKQ